MTISDESIAIILGIAEDGSMIKVSEHPLAVAAMLVIVTHGTEDKAVIGVIYVVLVIRLRLEQGIARNLTVSLDAHCTCVKKAVDAIEFEERRIGMLHDYLFDAVERSTDHRIPLLAGHEQLSYNNRKYYSYKVLKFPTSVIEGCS